MNGTGLPIVTPFAENGDLAEGDLRDLVGWVVDRGVDFVVPCGSNSEAELMTVDERARVVEIVVDETPDGVPVLAGTGHPGLRETLEQTARAAAAGADGALVVTPFYFSHGDDALEAYYRELADRAEIPIYLYSVPPYTDVQLSADVVERLAGHENVRGMKDSSGDIDLFQRERARTADAADFDLLVGSGGVYAHALEAGADGGILALANVAPEKSAEIGDRHRNGEGEAARALNADLVELNRAITARFGVPGLKAAMRMRGAPAGHPRKPHRPVDESARSELEELVTVAEP